MRYLYNQALHTYVQQHAEHLSVEGRLASSLEMMPIQRYASKSNSDKPSATSQPFPPTEEETPIKIPTSALIKANDQKKLQAPKDKAHLLEPKRELTSIIASLQINDSQLAYEALRMAGHIRHANEYLTDDEPTCENNS